MEALENAADRGRRDAEISGDLLAGATGTGFGIRQIKSPALWREPGLKLDEETGSYVRGGRRSGPATALRLRRLLRSDT